MLNCAEDNQKRMVIFTAEKHWLLLQVRKSGLEPWYQSDRLKQTIVEEVEEKIFWKSNSTKLAIKRIYTAISFNVKLLIFNSF